MSRNIEKNLLEKETIEYLHILFGKSIKEITLNELNKKENYSLLPLLSYINKNKKNIENKEIVEKLDQIYNLEFLQSTKIDIVENQLLDLLNKNKIKNRILKGSIVRKKLYPLPELRPKLDIDICVTEEDFIKVEFILKNNHWKLLQKQYYHYLYRKDGISIEIHRELFGYAWSSIYNIKKEDCHDYIKNGFTIQTEYVFMVLKLFSDKEISKIKLFDLYLYKKIYNKELLDIKQIAQKWDFQYPIKYIENIIKYRKHQSLQYPKLVNLILTKKSIKKIFGILFSDSKTQNKIYDNKKISRLKHIKRMFIFFFKTKNYK